MYNLIELLKKDYGITWVYGEVKSTVGALAEILPCGNVAIIKEIRGLTTIEHNESLLDVCCMNDVDKIVYNNIQNADSNISPVLICALGVANVTYKGCPLHTDIPAELFKQPVVAPKPKRRNSVQFSSMPGLAKHQHMDIVTQRSKSGCGSWERR